MNGVNLSLEVWETKELFHSAGLNLAGTSILSWGALCVGAEINLQLIAGKVPQDTFESGWGNSSSFLRNAGLSAGVVSIKFGNYVVMLNIHTCRLKNTEISMDWKEKIVALQNTRRVTVDLLIRGKVDFEIKKEFTVKMKNIGGLSFVYLSLSRSFTSKKNFFNLMQDHLS